jgi:hypothetical protein
MRNAQHLQHGRIDPASGTNLELAMDFVHYQQYLNVVDQDTLGQFYIKVLNPLVGAAGTTLTTDIKIYASIRNPRFLIPRPGAVSLASMTGSTRFAPAESSIMGAVDNMLGNIVSKIKPEEVVMDLLGYVLDKPQNAANPAPLVRKDIQYFSNYSNVDHVEYLGAEPSTIQMADDEHFGTSVLEMNADYLIKNKFSYLATVDWVTTDPVGKKLWTTAVGPNANLPSDLPFVTLTTITGNTGKCPTMIDYMANSFAFWKGGYVYIFDIVSSAFHEGKLDVCYQPYKFGSSDTLPEANSQYMLSHKMRNVGNVFKVTCPFLSATPVKNIWAGQSLDTALTPSSTRFDDFFCGTVSLFVSAQLRATPNIAPTVSINIYSMAAEDFHMYHQTMQGISLQLGVDYIPTPSYGAAESGEDRADNLDFVSMPSVTLAVSDATVGDVNNDHFGNDNTMSLKDMMKRYNYCDSVTTVVNPANNDFCSFSTLNVRVGTSNVFNERVEQMFRLYRGTMCFKVIPRNYSKVKWHGFVTVVPSIFAEDHSTYPYAYGDVTNPYLTGPSVARAYMSDTQIPEFKVPMLSAKGAALTRLQMDNAFVGETTTIRPWESAATYQVFVLNFVVWLDEPVPAEAQKITFEVYSAYSDESALGVFIGLPNCALATDEFGYSLWPDQWLPPPTARAHAPEESVKKENISTRAKALMRVKTPRILSTLRVPEIRRE